jgi:hypothetical protein
MITAAYDHPFSFFSVHHKIRAVSQKPLKRCFEKMRQSLRHLGACFQCSPVIVVCNARQTVLFAEAWTAYISTSRPGTRGTYRHTYIQYILRTLGAIGSRPTTPLFAVPVSIPLPF